MIAKGVPPLQMYGTRLAVQISGGMEPMWYANA